MCSGVDPNNSGKTSNDIQLKQKKPQVLFTPVASNGSVKHMNNMIATSQNLQSFKQTSNGGWTEDMDELVDTMALGDKHYEALLHVQNDEEEDLSNPCKGVNDKEEEVDEKTGDDSDKS
jgi:hypothetical protein